MTNDVWDKQNHELFAVLLDGGDIQRYHTKRLLRPQTVGQHSWRMIAILRHLTIGIEPGPSANLLMACALHDVSEIVTGDVPSPVKRANPALAKELNRVTTDFEILHALRPALSPEEAGLLRWLDLCEGALFSLQEVTMGNGYLKPTLARYLQYLGSTASSPDVRVSGRQHSLYTYLNERNLEQQ